MPVNRSSPARRGERDRPESLRYASSPPVQPPIPPTRVLNDRRYWIVGGVIVLITAGIFFHTNYAHFIRWDDPDYVMKNRLMEDFEGLKKIWNPGAPENQQYYPLVFTTYWLEYQLYNGWLAPDKKTRTDIDLRDMVLSDDEAEIFHVTNYLLHLLNIMLVLALLRKLGVSMWIAAGATAIFALHPTQVSSVVWVAERKNTLSAVFYLAAFMFYLRHRRTGLPGAYFCCLLAFVAALLSKTQMLTLPISLIAVEFWQQAAGGIRRARPLWILLLLAPMFVAGILAARVTKSVEGQRGPSGDPAREISTPVERPFIAARAGWSYLKTMVYPVDLAPVYVKWNRNLSDWRYWGSMLAWAIVLPTLFWFRRPIGGAILWGLTHFIVILAPALGLLPFNYQQYAYVADHFLYLALVGGGLAIATLAARLAGGSAPQWTPRRISVTAFGVVLLAAMAAKTYGETWFWMGNEVYWLRAIEKNDECFPANYNLGNHYCRVRPPEYLKAVPLYRRAWEIKRDNFQAFDNYIRTLIVTNQRDEALKACQWAMKNMPMDSKVYRKALEYVSPAPQPRPARR